MATCVQQITWHLKREELERMLEEAGRDYSALEFKMCITPTADTKYYISLIQVDTSSSDICNGAVTPAGADREVCPVPPDCNKNTELYISVLKKYYEENQISFTIGKEDFIEAFK